MKALVILYFVLTGLLFTVRGARVVVSGGHVASGLTSWLRTEQMDAILAHDTAKTKTAQSLIDDLFTRLAAETREGFEGGLILSAFGVIHLCIAAVLTVRFGRQWLRPRLPPKEPSHFPQPTPADGRG